MHVRDFNIEIRAKRGDVFDIRVVSAASGELQTTIALPRSVDGLPQALHTGGSGAFARSAGTRDSTPVTASPFPPVAASTPARRFRAPATSPWRRTSHRPTRRSVRGSWNG